MAMVFILPSVWTRSFWLAVLERVVGAALASLTTSVAAAGNLAAVDWPTALGVAGAVALASLGASVAKSPFGPAGSPSLVDTTDSPGRHARRD